MRHPIDDSLRDWLRAEERDEADAADAALHALFRDLPLEAPPPAFAERTLARARAAGALSRHPAAAPQRRPLSLAARLAVVWLALMSLGTLLASSYLVTALPSIDVGFGVRSFSRILSAFWQWIASGVVLWERLAEVGSLTSKMIEIPEVSAILLASLLVAAAALGMLRAILADQREWTYVERN